MNIAEKIYKEVRLLPEYLAQEILDFIEYIERKHGLLDKEVENLKEAQSHVMNHVWDNEEDEVWDEHRSC